jgi:hypothetical protein
MMDLFIFFGVACLAVVQASQVFKVWYFKIFFFTWENQFILYQVLMSPKCLCIVCSSTIFNNVWLLTTLKHKFL